MLTLFDYLPSQNGYKIRLLLNQLERPYRTEIVSIFEGHGQRPDYLAINPTGAVPAIRLEDGRVLAESNAILFYLAEGSRFLPNDSFARAKVLQWMSFESDYVQSTAGSMRYWTLTGQIPQRPFIIGDDYTIADISLFAYTHVARDAELPLDDYRHITRWIERVRSQPRFIEKVYPYSIDPHSSRELP